VPFVAAPEELLGEALPEVWEAPPVLDAVCDPPESGLVVAGKVDPVFLISNGSETA
jgi:hypothetical protein